MAEVNGEEITPFALQQEVSVQQRQILSVLGDDADPSLLDEATLSRQALESLIQREIVRQAAGDMKLRASDQVITDIIASMEQFQIDGEFSRDLFQIFGLMPTPGDSHLCEFLQWTHDPITRPWEIR